MLACFEYGGLIEAFCGIEQFADDVLQFGFESFLEFSEIIHHIAAVGFSPGFSGFFYNYI